MPLSKNIIGKGFIAKNLNQINKAILKSGYVIYAAGISNSRVESRIQLFKEIRLFKHFLKINKKNKIIYISTADITNSLKNKSKYVKNKIKIEKMIKKNSKRFIIIRLPQIIGKSKNKNTLMNFFFNKIKNKKRIKIFLNANRNILDIDDVIKMIEVIILNKKIKNQIIILSNKYFVKPIQILRIFEKKIKKRANYFLMKNKNQKWNLRYNQNVKYFSKAKINFNKDYLYKAIYKYY